MNSLLDVNVNDHVEKKNNLSYLSWAWAWAEVLKHDPQATWEVVEYAQPDGTTLPCMYMGEGSAMVRTRVTINGITRECVLPVMDHRNKAIKNPDAFAINTAIMRCMTKAISMHGLGLYIYAGEDLPESEKAAKTAEEKAEIERLEAEQRELDDLTAEIVLAHEEGRTLEAVKLWYSNELIRTSNEAREYGWSQLREWSAIRSAIKANNPHQTKEAA